MPARSSQVPPEGCQHYLLDGCLNQLVAVGAAHGQAQAVHGVQGCTEEAEEADLLSVLQPLVKPVWKAPVFGAVVELRAGCQHTREVDQRQHDIGHARQRSVDHLDRDLIKLILLLPDVRVDDLPHQVVSEKAKKKPQSQKDGDFPGWQKAQGNVFNLTG